jgi:hypothetical protein
VSASASASEASHGSRRPRTAEALVKESWLRRSPSAAASGQTLLASSYSQYDPRQVHTPFRVD